jgi:hypothetical protein
MLEEVRMEKLESTKNAIVVKLTTIGEKCSWDFFKFHKGHRPCIVIKELLHEGPSLVEEMDIVHNMSNFLLRPCTQGMM